MPPKAWYVSVIVGVLALASLVVATILELNGSDATHAWQAFAGLAVFFAGVHIPAPSQSNG
jgi:hypothetical protein